MLRRDLLLVVLVGSQGEPPWPSSQASALPLRGKRPSSLDLYIGVSRPRLAEGCMRLDR